jgi:hypothetical protein
MLAETASSLRENSKFIGMIQLAFDFENAALPDVIVVTPAKKALIAVPEVIVISPAEEPPVAATVPDVVAATKNLEAHPVEESPFVVVELWDELVSPCRKCKKVWMSKKNCSLKCPDLARFQDKLELVSPITYGTSDPNGSEANFGYY